MSDIPVQDHWDGRMTFLFAFVVQLVVGFIIYGFWRIAETMWKVFAQ
jgi:uncharacterized membrane protein